MNHTSNRSTLLLTELIIDLFIFIVCAAVCVGLLVRAHGMSRESTALAESVYIAQTAAEHYRAGEMPAGFYRADGTACPSAEADYFITVTELAQRPNTRLRAADIQVFPMDGNKNVPCYMLTVKTVRGVTAP